MSLRSGRGWRCALIAAVAAITGCGVGSPPGGNEGTCTIDSDDEKVPGYPFDLDRFNADVLPLLQSDCASCHAENGLYHADYAMFAGARKGNCAYVDTFNAFRDEVDLVVPANSKILFVLTASPTHLLKYRADVPAEADKLAVFNSFITDANATCVEAGSCRQGPVSYFDDEVYAEQIQPMINSAGGTGCAVSGCHLGTAGEGGAATGGQSDFSLFPAPAAGSAEMAANFQVVTGRMDLEDPDQSNFYIQATRSHASGASAVVSAQDAAIILDWIQAAKLLCDDDPSCTGGAISCADISLMNANVFRDEILPMMDGSTNYNDLQGGGGVATGCTRGGGSGGAGCHGEDRGAASLTLLADAPIEEQLANFSCFIDLISPSRSQILLCPTDEPGCAKYPHEGGRVLDGADDLNFQRLLSYLFASVAERTPVDFAFYARRINTIFDDRNAVDSLDNLTCADTGACHGISVAGQEPPNGSNFPLLPNVTDLNRLKINFGSARNFINFLDADQSSLILYPTNGIADIANPFATGIPHTGGAAFDVDSRFAIDIRTWAQGLRPDADGFQSNWLVAGDFSSTDADDEPLSDEDTLAPRIFDDGGQALAGIWDGLFEVGPDVDVGAFLDAAGGAVGAGRIAYAAAYLINTTTTTFDRATLTIETANDVEVRAGDALGGSPPGGGDATITFDIPAYRQTKQSVRVLLKIFEAAGDGGMVFRARLLDRDGDPIGDGDLIIRLDSTGGF